MTITLGSGHGSYLKGVMGPWHHKNSLISVKRESNFGPDEEPCGVPSETVKLVGPCLGPKSITGE